jgi:surface polysaccharide O-acyltransferase-like enzyme
MYSISKEESRAINALRVIFTIMVVYIHSHVGAEKIINPTHWINTVEYLISEVVCRCAVPGFFLISAIMLYKKDFTWKDNVKKKTRGLLIPYVLMNSLWIVFFLITKKIPVLSGFFNTQASDIYNWSIRGWINAYLGIDSLPVLGQTWFLRDLFVINLLSVLLKKIIDRLPIIWISLLSIIWIINFEIPVFCISIRSIYFFSLGYYIVKYNVSMNSIRKISTQMIAIAFSVLAVVDTVFHLYVEKQGITLFVGNLAHQMMILVGIIWLIKIAFNLQKLEGNAIYDKLMRYNFSIYLFHEFALTISRKTVIKIFGAKPVVQLLGYFVLPLVVICASVLLAIALEKKLPAVYDLLTGKRSALNKGK